MKLFEIKKGIVVPGIPVIGTQPLNAGSCFISLGETGRGRTRSLIRVDGYQPSPEEWLGYCHNRIDGTFPTKEAAMKAATLKREEMIQLANQVAINNRTAGYGETVWTPPEPWVELKKEEPRAYEGNVGLGSPGGGRDQVVSIQLKDPRPSREAGILVRDHSGYRGTWELSAPKWERTARVPYLGREGWCAQGDAGRMGGGPEYFLVLEPGAEFDIIRTGRLYGAPERLSVKWDGQELTCVPTEQLELMRAVVTDVIE